VGLIQAAVLQEDKWDPDKAWANAERHFDLTRKAAAGGARLVVWPESALPFYFDRSPVMAGRVRDLARQVRAYVLFGNDDRDDGGDGGDRIYVGAKMVDPEGALTLRYRKMRLVPFGEYVPLSGVFTLGGRYSGRIVQAAGEFTPGREAVVGEVDGRRLGVFICYEAIFPDQVRRFVARGADLLVNVTNDAWYGRTSAPYQHLAMAVFRAVENGKYLVRAANTGISAVVDPRGRVLERTPLFTPTAVVRDVPVVPGRTFYARHGDVFAWACLGAAVALTASVLRSGVKMDGGRAH
jgi:apolipoprotein N-acyltransferase